MAGTQDLLIESIAEIRAKVNDLHATSAVAERRLDDLHDSMTKIARTIHGDSEPERGMFPRVVHLEQQVEEINSTRKAVIGWAWGAAGTAVLAALSALSAWWKGAQ